MRQSFFSFLFVVGCMLNAPLSVQTVDAAQRNTDKLVTPVEQTETSTIPTTLQAPANARPPVNLDAADLKPTLFTPIIDALGVIQARQEAARDDLDKLLKARADDRTEEILGAIRGLGDRKVTIQGWAEQKEAVDGLRSFFESMRERLANVATVDDLNAAVESIQPPELNLDGVAREETLLALRDNFPTLQNVQEISANLASLTERLDAIAAQVESVDVQAEVVKLRKELQIVILVAAIILAVIIIQCAVFIIRWIVSFSKKAKSKAVAAQDAWFNKKLEAFLASRDGGESAKA